MDHEKAHELYLAHAGGLFAPGDREALRRHLQACERCRNAFALLDRALAPGRGLADRLPADPYLPARIRAIASDRPKVPPHSLAPALRWSLGSLALTLALALGVYLGHDLSRSAARTASDDPAAEFASSLSGSDLGDRMSTVIGQGNGSQP
jgi:anti-sigma factor RsiW